VQAATGRADCSKRQLSASCVSSAGHRRAGQLRQPEGLEGFGQGHVDQPDPRPCGPTPPNSTRLLVARFRRVVRSGRYEEARTTELGFGAGMETNMEPNAAAPAQLLCSNTARGDDRNGIMTTVSRHTDGYAGASGAGFGHHLWMKITPSRRWTCSQTHRRSPVDPPRSGKGRRAETARSGHHRERYLTLSLAPVVNGAEVLQIREPRLRRRPTGQQGAVPRGCGAVRKSETATVTNARRKHPVGSGVPPRL